MGSRAIAVIARNGGAATRRFGVDGSESGILYTRTGRRFSNTPETEREVVKRLQKALEKSGAWDRLASD